MTTTNNTAVIRQLEQRVESLQDKLDAETKARKDAQIIGQDLSRQFERHGLVVSAALRGERHPKEPDNDGRMDAVRALVEENKGLRCQVERLRADRIAAALEHAGRGGAEYSQGVAGDGAAILKDGHAMTIEEILSELRHPPAPMVPEGVTKPNWREHDGGAMPTELLNQPRVLVQFDNGALSFRARSADDWFDIVDCPTVARYTVIDTERTTPDPPHDQ